MVSSRTEFEKSLSPIGTRIHVIGNSASGKSTLARRLALTLDANFVELDALNWLPNWVGLNETDPDELLRRFKNATQGDKWVVAGSYTRFAKQSFWPRLDTVVWLDLPVRVLIWRVIRRSWHRWRSKELLWGTNVERFLAASYSLARRGFTYLLDPQRPAGQTNFDVRGYGRPSLGWYSVHSSHVSARN